MSLIIRSANPTGVYFSCIAGFLALVLVGLFAGSARGATPDAAGDAELASKVHAIFDAKCADCHSPRAKKVKKFGTIFDVPAMIKDTKRELIKPGDPDGSTVWTSIEDGTMPPEDATTGQLSKEQKELVKQWVLAGAPEFGATSGPTTKPSSAVAESAEGPALPRPFSRRLVVWLGHFHPLLVHFPISLLVTAAMGEALFLWRRQPWLPGAVRLCTLIGTMGGIVSGALGWFNWYTHSQDDAMLKHQWLGTAAMIWAIPLLILSERGFRRGGEPHPRVVFRVLLFVGVLLTGLAAHLGGEIVYGPDYIKFFP